MSNSLTKRINLGMKVKKYSITPEFPRNMLLEVTNLCNNKCIFCANEKSSRRKGFIEFNKALCILKEAYNNGTREVGFYATGEPLLNKDLEKYIYYAKEIGYEYTYLTTNGVLLDEERANKLIDSGIDSIKVSLNAVNREDYIFIHGVDYFDKVLKNIISLSKIKKYKKFKLYISCILTNQTVESKYEFKKYFEKYVDEIWFDNCSNIGGYMCEINDLIAVNKDSGHHFENNICPLIFKNLYVTYEGYLTMCCTDFQNYLVVADLNKIPLAEAWNNELAVKLRKAHLNHKLEKTLCYNCIYNCETKVKPLIDEYAVKFEYKTWNHSDLMKRRICEWSMVW